MFDTHCHLNFPAFDGILPFVIDDARSTGVNNFLIPATNLETSKKALEIASDHQNIYAAVGIHPTEDLEKVDLNSILLKIESWSENEKVIAVGETGLDYYRFISPASLQKKFFVAQLKLAARLDLALVVHNRQSTKDVIAIIEDNWSPHMQGRIVYHCSTVEDIILEHALKRNIFIGVDGDVTYDPAKQDFIRKVPLELLVLETDSPYLTPEPVRQSRELKFPNQPKNLKYIAEKVSQLKGESIEKIKSVTTKNAMKLFELG